MGEAEGEHKATLHRLCRENGLSYGVLWRFDPRNSMLLTMEDAVYEDDQMGQVIGNFLPQVHLLGEGAIGQAALTGKYRWMLADCPGSQEVGSEVLRQLSAGVQTLVVIPLENQGVVLFGATEKIMERADFVDKTKRLFREMDRSDGIFQAGNVPSSSNSETRDMNSFASLISQGNSCNGNLNPINSGIGLEELLRSNCSFTNPTHSTAFTNEEDSCHLFANLPTLTRGKCSFTEAPCISSWSSDGSVLTSLEPPSSNTYCMKLNASAGDFGMDQIQPFGETVNQLPEAPVGLKRPFDEFNTTNYSTDVSGSSMIDDLSQWFAGSPENCLVGSAGCFDSINEHPVSAAPCNYTASNIHCMERDLFDSFGVDPGCVMDENSWDILGNSIQTPSNAIPGFHSTSRQRKGLFSELGIEELLEGMGSGITKSSPKDPLSSTRRKGVDGSPLNGGTSNLAHKSQVGLWIDDSYSINAGGASAGPPKRAEGQAKPSRKRARPGESTRPRPKDRQQIQDRLKELRGIIPNGAKCSIDALLDRTIKHMLFLQNVTKYADKLKQSGEPKLYAHENGADLKDEYGRIGEAGNSGGTTWAYEMDSQSMVCPIIVEDLSSPGQMLIEMLCEDRGLFLEIADIIRGFGLNILKGAMEARDNKIWSRFIVEATRQVTRIDVFWSLVQILQQTPAKGQDFANPPKNHLTEAAILPSNDYSRSALPLSIS